MAAVLQGADPWFVNLAVSPKDARAAIAGLWGQSASGVGVEGGVIPGQGGTGLAVSSTTPSASMAVTVSRGGCVVPRANQWGFECWMETSGNVDILAANATNPRIDTVIARVRDSDLGDGSNGVWSKGWGIEVVGGIPSASPVAPDLSAIPSCIPLADVRVDAGVTTITGAKITDRRYFTRAAGGIRYSGGDGGRIGAYPWDLRITPSGAIEGWDTDTGAWVMLANGRTWSSFTPTFRYAGGDGNPAGVVSAGTGGSITGRYQKLGRTLMLKAQLLFGTGGQGGTGIITMDLPDGATGTSVLRQKCGTATIFHPGPIQVIEGSCWVSEGENQLTIYFPNNVSTNAMSPLINASPTSPTAGTGVPQFPGLYTLDDNVRVWLDCLIETAS